MTPQSPLLWLAIAWAVVTLVFLVLLIWRSFITMREDDQLFIGTSESGMATEQNEIQTKLKRIAPFMKVFGVTSAVLLLAIACTWTYRLLEKF